MDISPCGIPQHEAAFPNPIQNPMPLIQTKSRPAKAAFTLVELLVVIAIISILMTAGSIGLSGIGGKGVTSGVANAEALFNEARSTAVGKNLRACVLVSKTLTNNRENDLKRIVVAYEETEKDPTKANFGQAKNPNSATPNWELSSRGAVLPDQTFFSFKFSKKDHAAGSGDIENIPHSRIVGVKAAFQGTYYIYEFNSQGICKTPGASFVIGSGAKRANATEPVVTSSAKRDFGGFVIWRNGGTSVFRSPDQVSSNLPSTGASF
jgi:prepilin-type N-terminal cleavage/methylation domain-containing protein